MRRCGNCGSKEIRKVSQKGKMRPWRDFPAVELLVDLELGQCMNCGQVGYAASDADAIDEAVQRSISMQVRKFIEMIVSKTGCTQIELARNHLGITPERLSVIKNGKEVPSFQLFNLLKMVALLKDGYEVSSPEYRSAI